MIRIAGSCYKTVAAAGQVVHRTAAVEVPGRTIVAVGNLHGRRFQPRCEIQLRPIGIRFRDEPM